MSVDSGSPALLDNPVAQELLHSAEPAQLAYCWTDGTPRVVPIWFTWTGSTLVIGSPPSAPKVDVLRHNPQVAITINTHTPPYKVLLLRGRAEVELVDGVAVEYAAAARRYFGEEQGAAWCAQVATLFSQMARIEIRPTWVEVHDFQTRLPQAIANAMAAR